MTPSGARERRPVILNGGRELNAWIEAGGLPERPVRFRELRHRWQGFWFERHEKITAKRCADINLPRGPVFIVGMWRTGSTVLHTALENATGWSTPRTWQCFRPADFLLLPPPSPRREIRPMDAGVVESFSPQEDEFASLLMGEPSTYRAFIDPRRFDDLAVLLAEWKTPAPLLAPLSNRWETFLRAVLRSSPGTLLLKSPNHTFRIPWLANRFPDSQFIWILRRTQDVLASNRRMWTAMIDRYGQWALDPQALDRFLHVALSNHDDLLAWARHSIADRLLVTDFEEVIGDTKGLVSRIRRQVELNSALGLPAPPSGGATITR